ncbi:MAG: transcriptional regulatory protein OmpR [Rhodocyclaceae bacterium]|jgi:DNA-binding response OmpR family regulator|nr:MAG: transcriptional regulatory protein OmpR [Rhodocyclaceae bacterium]TND05193.1 MAG: transcriptional regulatory protein OmpR [Rhodocyclaceae bacterium]
MSAKPDVDEVLADQPVCSTERKCTLLIVDDDAELRDLLVRYLQTNGFDVVAVADGLAMEKYLKSQPADLVILDLMLPGKDGLTIARELRSGRDLPVIMLSARGDDVDRIVGLEVGADDYLAKPFNSRELLARIRAMLRRRMTDKTCGTRAVEMQTHLFGPYRLNMQTHYLTRSGQDVALTTADFKLLCLFALHPNQLLSRDTLMDMLKGYERASFDRSIDVRVTRLRRKIEDNPAAPVFIRTVRGEGYMFTPDREAG